ncbi:hypothetical protein Fcan01_23873 [Folsomia candida]|uniref:Uncharacterized protein n=1 Tax=Folsomia candida TaxID=158441 RepID=A0A226D908_FOLCA|nr:hypothetical protein Fcan01_23873 [Folsomia candida]
MTVAIFTKSNSNLTYCPTCVDPTPSQASWMVLQPFSTSRGREVRVTSDLPGYEFLTCYAQKWVTFAFYVAPFLVIVWISVLLSILLTTVGIMLYKEYWFEHKSSFSPCFLVLGSLFDEPARIPKSLESSLFVKLILGSWPLAAILLTKCYNVLMISDLNDPLRISGTSPGMFIDLVCSKKYWYKSELIGDHPLYKISLSNIEDSMENLDHPVGNLRKYDADKCFRLFSTPNSIWYAILRLQ